MPQSHRRNQRILQGKRKRSGDSIIRKPRQRPRAERPLRERLVNKIVTLLTFSSALGQDADIEFHVRKEPSKDRSASISNVSQQGVQVPRKRRSSRSLRTAPADNEHRLRQHQTSRPRVKLESRSDNQSLLAEEKRVSSSHSGT